ncbi:hypothetical protein [Streptomyces sp. NPDC093097]|uniref:hypothetical protein n=1 Tax=Streptomyces sp. NPDC093097 TaxID=3366027 RepID=UPI0038306589
MTTHDTIPMALDGYLDDEPIPGPRDTARFRLISSPTDDLSQETVLACTTGDPRIVDALFAELRPGDLLRVRGTLTLPTHAAGIVQLCVDALELLQPIPLAELAYGPDDQAPQLLCDRLGPYTAVRRTDTSAVQLWAPNGTWIGTATNPTQIAPLIAQWETTFGTP